MKQTKIAIIGAGWRAGFYLRLTLLMPDKFEVVGWVVRDQAKAKAFPVKTYTSVSELLVHEKPDYAISAVTWLSNPDVLALLVEAGIPVLSETPPAGDADALRKLWSAVGGKNLVRRAIHATPDACRSASCDSAGRDWAGELGAGLLNPRLSRRCDNAEFSGSWLW
jgi:hypothetical protein